MSRIYTDHNGLAVNAISMDNGVDVNGHQYQVLLADKTVELNFQQGTVPEHVVNGLTSEALLEILAHRITVLQEAVPCRENAVARTHIETALLWLERRTAKRLERGVEGTEAA